MSTRLDFKRDPRLPGAAGEAQGERGTNIKMGVAIVGRIHPPTEVGPDADKWSISLMVAKRNHKPTPEDPATAHWIRLLYRGASEAETREFIRRKWENIRMKYDLRPVE